MDGEKIVGFKEKPQGDGGWINGGFFVLSPQVLDYIDYPSTLADQSYGSFPDGHSALNLAAARLRHIAGTAWSTKRYLNIELLKDQQMRGAITA